MTTRTKQSVNTQSIQSDSPEQTCLNCKTKYVCELKSDLVHSCSQWTDHFDFVKIEYSISLTGSIHSTRTTVKQCPSLRHLNYYAQNELNLVWKQDYRLLFKGYYQDPQNKMIVYEIR